MLKEVDVLVYDLPEVGGRTWTYVSTMALSMQAAAKKSIPFVVLDRPNPIGGEIVEGALLDPAFKSFVGMYPIPARHGMTVGELATFFNKEFGIGVNLIVAQTANWRRSQWFADTGLPWRNPSPNLRSPAALNNYPGTVYFEGTNLTEGRGTDRPFEQIGAPWLDAAGDREGDEQQRLPGVRFEAITMPVERGRGEIPGPDHRGHPLRRHGSRSLPSRPDVAVTHRRDSPAPSEGVRVGQVDRPVDGIGQGQAGDRRRNAAGAARAVGSRSRGVPRTAASVPALRLTEGRCRVEHSFVSTIVRRGATKQIDGSSVATPPYS